MSGEKLDLLIIGAGLAGLFVADVAASEGLNYLIIPFEGSWERE